jgi:glycosyltransferase involved in cell wall biosynthesis
MRLAVDAFNLAADRRGMGRIVRQVLESLDRLDTAETVLVFKRSAEGGITPRELRRARIDAVWYPWNAMRFRPRAPSIVTINDPFAFTYPARGFIARRREQSPIRRAIRKADRLFTISKWAAEELTRLFRVKPERIRVVTPAIEPFWHRVEIPSQIPYVLFVGGPDARKNAPLLFRAFDAAFAHNGPELVVAGTLSDRDEREFERMRAARRRVRPSDEQLRGLYSGALAVAVPSLAEGFGLPVLEAMACGAPVLASNATALPEAAGGAAMLVAASDETAWHDALRRIAEDADLRGTLRERGFQRVRAIDRDGYAKALLESAGQLRKGVR